MSTFQVLICDINQINPHPNAHSLDIVRVCGSWDIIARKNQYKVGDLVIFVPPDSILPQELEYKLFPPDSKITLKKHRVRAIKIRNVISPGMLIDIDVVREQLGNQWANGDCVADKLGITKYEPPAWDLPANMGVKTGKKKKDNTSFIKYTDIENFKYYDRLFQDNEEVYLSTKLHGCLQASTLITLADGSKKTIKDIVDNKLHVKLLGVDKNNELVETEIVNHFNNGITNDWLSLKFTKKHYGTGNSFHTINCTPNHKFYNYKTKEYKQAKDLKIGEKIYSVYKSTVLGEQQKSILLGKLLGDGSLNLKNNTMYFGHKKEHEAYLQYTLRALNDIAGPQHKDQISGFGTIMTRGLTKQIFDISIEFEKFFKNGKKIVPKDIKLDAISLAFWYMDDGSLSHSETQRDRASFATCGFDEESIDNLMYALNKLNFNPIKYYTDDKYWRLRFNTKDAYKLFDLIAPYIHPVMKYKLPREYQTIPFVELKTISQQAFVLNEQILLNVEPIKHLNKINKTKYDLETTTHNFIANNIIVHNSSFRAGWFKTEANTWYKKVLKFCRVLPEWEFCWGSRNVQIQNKFSHKGFYDEDVYSKMVKQYDLKNRIPKGYAVYGEIVGPGIQKGYTYDLPEGEHKLYVYDILYEGKWLDYEQFVSKVGEFKLERVNECYVGPYDEEKILSYLELHPFKSKEINEGLVLKPKLETTCSIGRKILKIINPNYYLQDTTEFH